MSKLQHFAVAALAALAVSGAHAGTIIDNYMGASGSAESIGGSNYDITQATITRVGSVLTIAISTAFAGNATSVNSVKIGYGDLFLSNAWNPSGTAGTSALTSYTTDNLATSGTIWKYGLNIDAARYNTGAVKDAVVSLYSLNNPTNSTSAATINSANINSSNTVMTSAGMTSSSNLVYRTGQADTVNTSAAAIANGNVSDTNKNGTFNTTTGLVTFQIDIAGTDMMNWTSFAMHWGETCQNDVIEGITRVVPEPGSIALLGLGLFGLMAARRRKMI